MSSRVLIFILLAMARNHGTLSFVFGPLDIYTLSQEASSPAPSVSTDQWAIGADADTTTATTPFTRPTGNRRRPNPNASKIVFPSSDDNFPSSSKSNKPIVYPQDNTNPETNPQLSPDRTSRPVWLKQERQGPQDRDSLFFNGPSFSRGQGDRVWGRPNRRPMVTAPVGLVSEAGPPDLTTDSASPLPASPCPCPTTSEFNPLCVEVQGAQVTMRNLSHLKCAQFCLGPKDVRLLFHGTCRKLITKLVPFIHDRIAKEQREESFLPTSMH